MNIATLAAQASAAFETSRRADRVPYWKLADDRPQWVYEFVRAAHGDQLPNDWRYAAIVAALEFIAECGLGDCNSTAGFRDDLCNEFADGYVDIYTGDLIRWVGGACSSDRIAYCDQAVEEGLATEGSTLIDRIQLGQYVESVEVFSLVWRALAQRLDSEYGDPTELDAI